MGRKSQTQLSKLNQQRTETERVWDKALLIFDGVPGSKKGWKNLELVMRLNSSEGSQCNCKWDLGACHSKAVKEARLVERKVCFISDASNWGLEGRGADFYPKDNPPHSPHPTRNPHPHLAPTTDSQWVRALYIEGGGLHAETAQSPLITTLKLVISGLIILKLVIGCLTDYFKCSYSSVPRSVCSYFLEASSWNCGSLCHG